MSIERDSNMVFDPAGTLRDTTSWISKHDEGLPERLKNVRCACLPNRSNVDIEPHVAAVLPADALFKEKDRVLCELDDIDRCIQFHNVLKERFSKELRLLLY